MKLLVIACAVFAGVMSSPADARPGWDPNGGPSAFASDGRSGGGVGMPACPDGVCRQRGRPACPDGECRGGAARPACPDGNCGGAGLRPACPDGDCSGGSAREAGDGGSAGGAGTAGRYKVLCDRMGNCRLEEGDPSHPIPWVPKTAKNLNGQMEVEMLPVGNGELCDLSGRCRPVDGRSVQSQNALLTPADAAPPVDRIPSGEICDGGTCRQAGDASVQSVSLRQATDRLDPVPAYNTICIAGGCVELTGEEGSYVRGAGLRPVMLPWSVVTGELAPEAGDALRLLDLSLIDEAHRLLEERAASRSLGGR